MNESVDTYTKKYTLKIRDMLPEDKPREKLLKYGPSNLSIHELLAVVLHTGTKKEDVLAMASRVLKEYGEHTLSHHGNAAQLARDLDIPLIKAQQIVACSELGRRFFGTRESGMVVIRSAKDVFEYVYDMRTLPKEQLRGIYLNAHYRITHDEIISIGTIDTNLVHPREVFKPAIEYGAAAIVLVHNHPSGVTLPSQADREITEQLVEVGKLVGIPLIDHVIISREAFLSIEVAYV